MVTRELVPVIVTLRDGEQAPDIVTALWKDDLLPRLDVVPLTSETTARLVARVLDGRVDPAALERLWLLPRGSPLFLRTWSTPR